MRKIIQAELDFFVGGQLQFLDEIKDIWVQGQIAVIELMGNEIIIKFSWVARNTKGILEYLKEEPKEPQNWVLLKHPGIIINLETYGIEFGQVEYKNVVCFECIPFMQNYYLLLADSHPEYILEKYLVQKK